MKATEPSLQEEVQYYKALAEEIDKRRAIAEKNCSLLQEEIDCAMKVFKLLEKSNLEWAHFTMIRAGSFRSLLSFMKGH